MDLISRSDAMKRGMTHYFTGKLCKNGHIDRRFVSSFGCAQCAFEREQLPRYKIKASAKGKAWRLANLDVARKKNRDWHIDNPEASIANTLRWQRKNPEKITIAKDKWNSENKDRIRETGTIWRLANPEKVRANHGNRWARTQAAEGSFSGDDILNLMAKQTARCASPYCAIDISVEYSVDHNIPLCRGGSNWPSNLQLLCTSCNSSKRNRTMEEWQETLAKRGRRKVVAEDAA